MSLATWLASSGPDVAIEIASEAVSVALLGFRGSEPVLEASGSAPLPAGAVVASLTAQNIVDRPAVVEALRAACQHAGQRPRRAALVIPDLAARVALIRFDQLPARREDLDQLIRWQVRKSIPFPMEEACITHSPGTRSGAGGEFVTVAARRDIIREYEGVCDEAGIYAGLVDVSTLGLVNLYLGGSTVPAGDWLVVHMRPDYTSIAILRGADLIFFRTRPEGEEESLSDVVHQTAMYYQDRLGGQGFARVFAGGSTRVAGGVEIARRDLEVRLGHAVDTIDANTAAPPSERVPRAEPLPALAPLVGMLLRSKKGAAAA
jgi:type IV pilus assembly protein PilM